MSADNGVYILKTNKQYRVKHLGAIDNLYWDYSIMQSIDTPVSTRILEMFGDCKYTYNYEMALKIASKILKYLPTCEYGVQLIDAEMKWTTILKNAKLHIDKEINSIKDGNKWEDEVINLLSLKERMKEYQFKPKQKISNKVSEQEEARRNGHKLYQVTYTSGTTFLVVDQNKANIIKKYSKNSSCGIFDISTIDRVDGHKIIVQ